MPHYYSEKQTSPLKLGRIKALLRGNELEFYTGSGVFSLKKVDIGSALLINKAIVKDGWRVLDLGCGYGPVGIAIAKAFPSSEVVMTDVNQRAIQLAKRNVKESKVKNAEIVRGDMYEKVEGEFDTILLNPPQKAGKDICFKMIEGARDFLKDEGTLQVVARHQRGGKTLSRHMEEVFGNVEAVAKGSGYRVYLSRKSD